MGLLIAVPVLVRIDLLVESIFSVGVMVFLLSYLIPLLRDLENPFAYFRRPLGCERLAQAY